MYDLHYWPTPNGKKVTILLEELGVAVQDRARVISAAATSSPPSSSR